MRKLDGAGTIGGVDTRIWAYLGVSYYRGHDVPLHDSRRTLQRFSALEQALRDGRERLL